MKVSDPIFVYIVFVTERITQQRVIDNTVFLLGRILHLAAKSIFVFGFEYKY